VRKHLAQDNDDDVLRVYPMRGSTRIEPDERRERPEAEKHVPYHEHEEKLTASRSRVSQSCITVKHTPFDFVRQHTVRSLRNHTVNSHTRNSGYEKGRSHKDSDDHTSTRTTVERNPHQSDSHHTKENRRTYRAARSAMMCSWRLDDRAPPTIPMFLAERREPRRCSPLRKLL
jgi:hypothetical protein